jgi:hypothetical protein
MTRKTCDLSASNSRLFDDEPPAGGDHSVRLGHPLGSCRLKSGDSGLTRRSGKILGECQYLPRCNLALRIGAGVCV